MFRELLIKNPDIFFYLFRVYTQAVRAHRHLKTTFV